MSSTASTAASTAASTVSSTPSTTSPTPQDQQSMANNSRPFRSLVRVNEWVPLMRHANVLKSSDTFNVADYDNDNFDDPEPTDEEVKQALLEKTDETERNMLFQALKTYRVGVQVCNIGRDVKSLENSMKLCRHVIDECNNGSDPNSPDVIAKRAEHERKLAFRQSEMKQVEEMLPKVKDYYLVSMYNGINRLMPSNVVTITGDLKFGSLLITQEQDRLREVLNDENQEESDLDMDDDMDVYADE